MKSRLNYLHLREVGLLELVFALTPILMGFALGPIPLSLLMWGILIVIAFFKYGRIKFKVFRPLLFFAIYWIIHQFFLMLMTDVNSNATIAQLVYFASVFILYPSLEENKLRGAMNWVALISIAGLLYQWGMIASGNSVHPLQIPGLTMAENRLETDSFRPSSFYMEPAAYVAFMIFPLDFALREKKYIWSVLLILSIFLTTSTTGIILSFILLVTSLVTNKVKVSSILIVLILGAGMVYALNTYEEFALGVEKMENTDVSTNIRLSQGPRIVGSMQPEEFVFGVPYSSAYNYCKSGRLVDVVFFGDAVFMSTFWNMILLYGIIGLLLYIGIYWKILRSSRKTIPLVVSLLVTLFSSGYCIGAIYTFMLITLLVISTSSSN